MHKVTFGNVTTITEFIYNADNNGDDEVGGELNFSGLTNLDVVKLSFSKLNSLDFINTLPSLVRTIGCPRNDFYQMELPNPFPNLERLMLLNISNSGIKGTIPDLGHLDSLLTLQLEGNTTNEYVTGWRAHLKNRHSISTSYTGLTAVASDFSIPANLNKIDLRYNGLSAAEVTKVLEACVAQTSFTSGTVDVRFQLNGGDSLDSAGVTARDTLVARGVTVNFGGTQ